MELEKNRRNLLWPPNPEAQATLSRRSLRATADPDPAIGAMDFQLEAEV